MNNKFGAALAETLKECYKLSGEVFLTTKQENLITNILATKLNTTRDLSATTEVNQNPLYITEKSLDKKRIDMVRLNQNSNTFIDEIFEAKYLWSDDFGYEYWAIQEVCRVLNQLNTHNTKANHQSHIMFYYVLLCFI
ncbi:MAG: hypothetical protein COA97_02335 [Flavobacteriales bacterium]|nr:MAG: hypothetical protein COA97_02335 [Flavobacteriales bacterium]